VTSKPPPLTPSLSPAGVISNEDSTDVTLASQLNKDFLKKRDNEEDSEVSLFLPHPPLLSVQPSRP
jgi:hypothetical protein